MSRELVAHTLGIFKDLGVENIVICPSSRNAFYVQALKHTDQFKVYTSYEERAASFYALGILKRTLKPVVIITTSGTAAAEILPAAMEACYCGLPLILLTTDRPRRYRFTGAPQSAEQVGIFSHYVHKEFDIAADEVFDLQFEALPKGPIHLNVCIEDPKGHGHIDPHTKATWKLSDLEVENDHLTNFLAEAEFPFVIVSGLAKHEQKYVEDFLLRLGAPVYLEASSGLRESVALDQLSIRVSEGIWDYSHNNDYPIDSILRIGGVPTIRMWRDLDESEGKIKLLSISSLPFTGASWSQCLVGNLSLLNTVLHSNNSFLSAGVREVSRANNINSSSCLSVIERDVPSFAVWKKKDNEIYERRLNHYKQFPLSEPALIYHLSRIIDEQAFVYLGNSLPIREWDMAATIDIPHSHIGANRGVNGIDGQLSTFFGMCPAGRHCWGIFGDLTTLYDMSAPWILAQNPDLNPVCVVINNSGGKIFERMYRDKAFYNEHSLNFGPLAEFWGMEYALWHSIPDKLPPGLHQKPYLLEIIPSEEQTHAFWAADAKKI